MPVTEPLEAARNLNWRPTLEIEYLGGALPLAGASISSQVRLYDGAPGEPLAEQADVTFSDAAAPTAAEPTLRVLTLSPLLTKGQLAGLPGLHQPEAGDPQVFRIEFKVTYADDAQDSLWLADFIVTPGVNDE